MASRLNRQANSGREQYDVAAVQWSSAEADHARRIRMQVFVEEQNVPAELELDDMDPEAFHVLARNANQQPCGTGRLFSEPGHPGTAHIGRMAVLSETRGTGCGTAVLRALVTEAKSRGFERVILSAQTHAVAFYRRFGFVEYGDEYVDAGIKHREMELPLSSGLGG